MDRDFASTLGAWAAGIVVFVVVLYFLWDIQSTLSSVEKRLDEIHHNLVSPHGPAPKPQ